MQAVIISIGDELTTGQNVDTNSAWLSRQLTAAGVAVIRHVTVGDDVSRIETSFRHALTAAELVIVTGGLGPTADDLTRQALAAATDSPLEENAEALAQIEAFFARWQRPLTASNRTQALAPRGSRIVHNPRGTAPGLWHEKGGRNLFALPGVPAEMKNMYAATIAPLVAKLAAGRATHIARVLTFGMAEARMGELIADLMVRGRHPLVGTTASEAVITVRIIATADSPDAARELAQRDAAEVRQRLGDAVFGSDDDTLHGVVAAELLRRKLTIATAESCTGGLLATRLTDVPGSSDYFLRGYVTYSNQTKSELLGVPAQLIAEQGAVSAAVARAMAEGCRSVARTDMAIGITGIAGPGGGSAEKPIGLVYVGLADADATEVNRLLLGEHLSRIEIRDRAVKNALNMLRLRCITTSGIAST